MERPQKMGLSVSDHGQSLATFKHEPLPSKLSIRILTLRGCTSQGDLIQCDMTTYNLTPNEVPAYTALSYTWGGFDRKTPICVNGLRMDVTHNLWEALVHLRAIEERETSIGAAWQVRFASGYTTLPWCTVQQVLFAHVPPNSSDDNPIVSRTIPLSLFFLFQTYKARRTTLGVLLSYAFSSNCTDRDRVYALLGLACDGPAKAIVPSYTLSACDVFCATIRAMVQYIASISDWSNVEPALSFCQHQPSVTSYAARENCDDLECGA